MEIPFIAYSYLPDPRVKSFRAAKIAQAFRASGHEVDVITARLPNEQDFLRTESRRLRVHPPAGGPESATPFLTSQVPLQPLDPGGCGGFIA